MGDWTQGALSFTETFGWSSRFNFYNGKNFCKIFKTSVEIVLYRFLQTMLSLDQTSTRSTINKINLESDRIFLPRNNPKQRDRTENSGIWSISG